MKKRRQSNQHTNVDVPGITLHCLLLSYGEMTECFLRGPLVHRSCSPWPQSHHWKPCSLRAFSSRLPDAKRLPEFAFLSASCFSPSSPTAHSNSNTFRFLFVTPMVFCAPSSPHRDRSGRLTPSARHNSGAPRCRPRCTPTQRNVALEFTLSGDGRMPI